MHACPPVNAHEIDHALAALAAGRAVVLVDDTDDAREGSLVFAAEMATPELMASAVRRTFGYIRVALRGTDCDRLKLPLMYSDRDGGSTTGHTVAVDAVAGTTGISATERAHTARLLADPGSGPDDFTRPGHVVPVRTEDGGVLSRLRASESAVDLARLAGLRPAAVLCEIVSECVDGEVAHGDEPAAFAVKYGLALVTVTELAAYRQRVERHVMRMAELPIPVQLSGFRAIVYGSTVDDVERIAFVHGELGAGHEVLVHEHVEHPGGDLLGSAQCACSARLAAAMAEIIAAGSGVVVYHRPHTGHPGSVSNERSGASRPERRCASLQAERNPSASGQILSDLGIRSIRIFHDETTVSDVLAANGPPIVGRIPLPARDSGGQSTALHTPSGAEYR